MILLTACGKPAPDSAAARTAARRIADEKVRACALARTGSETGMAFISDARSDTAWSYEYEGDGRLCMVWVGMTERSRSIRPGTEACAISAGEGRG
ncbi:hypothetical protein [Stenotrophomonas sp. 364]|uniref:hypothetical protein n=1 Tax=Stenotrophomonas sp. 364 TaxID=2691571 RepID=UPI001319669C|nr:hypothetical protein [Stenotrophomonas sp. 364]QHB70590.1 hypothetical protein GQ674_04320 [Stenotrophomonas sp. 364]